ncbi:MAG: hypothetical protein AAFV07_10075, partial [Bacteroidota bacterium]
RQYCKSHIPEARYSGAMGLLVLRKLKGKLHPKSEQLVEKVSNEEITLHYCAGCKDLGNELTLAEVISPSSPEIDLFIQRQIEKP